MQQSKAYVIKAATRNLKATIASHALRDVARKAEYVAYRYGPYARKVTLPRLELRQ